MTPAEARAIVRRECKRRKRKWGDENAARLRAMRLEIKILKESPMRYVKAVTRSLAGKRHMGDGAYSGKRRQSLSRHEETA